MCRKRIRLESRPRTKERKRGESSLQQFCTIRQKRVDYIFMYIRRVTERCGQILGTSCTCQNNKKYPYQHVSGNISFVSYNYENAIIVTNFVGDCLVASHVLPYGLTGNHYRDFLLHNLPEHECGTYMMVLGHILAVLCEMFSVTPIMTNEQIEKDTLHGLLTRHI
jgi:hypothetical protein